MTDSTHDQTSQVLHYVDVHAAIVRPAKPESGWFTALRVAASFVFIPIKGDELTWESEASTLNRVNQEIKRLTARPGITIANVETRHRPGETALFRIWYSGSAQ
jgi:hypothetical protein